MSCDAKWYICNCGSDFSRIDYVSHANNGNSGHFYRGRCCKTIDGVIEMVANGHPVCCIGKPYASLQEECHRRSHMQFIVLAMNAIETTPTIVETKQTQKMKRATHRDF